MRVIGVVTTSRADYGIYLPILRRIEKKPELKLHLLVSGTHLLDEFGRTIEFIEQDGFPVGDQVEIALSSDSPEDIAKAMGQVVRGFAASYSRLCPDLLVVLGDRFEMHAAALAALPFKIPVAHIHGGETTQGAIDESLRHSMTKLSHLHFVSTADYARRVEQLGEEPWRVTVSGAPSLDNLGSLQLLDRRAIEAEFGLRLPDRFLLVTFHPTTLEYENVDKHAEALVAALRAAAMPVVFTLPNADTAGRTIRRRIFDFIEKDPKAQAVESLGTLGYFSTMALASAMVGNSSSGLIEAPSFELPVVNIGNRQKGRVRAANVIDVGYQQEEIEAGVRQAISPAFRDGLSGSVNPYWSGGASAKIVERLLGVELNDQLVIKRFNDLTNKG